MPWTDNDAQNWSNYESEAKKRLDEIGATPAGHEMFADLLRGGRGRVRPRGFGNQDLTRARKGIEPFVGAAKRHAGEGPIDTPDLDAALNVLCPLFPIC